MIKPAKPARLCQLRPGRAAGWALLWVWGASVGHVSAEDFQSAADRLARSYNQFFESAQKMPSADGPALSGIYNDYVAGPSQALQRVQIETTQSVLKGAGVKVTTGEASSSVESDNDAPRDLSWLWGDGKTGKSTSLQSVPARAPAHNPSRDPSHDSGYAAGGAGLPAPTTPALEPVIIDGTEVPRELEFPGPAKK